MTASLNSTDFFTRSKNIILEQSVEIKCVNVKKLFTDWKNGIFSTLIRHQTIDSIEEPGRPEYPQLVTPMKVAKRRMGTPEGVASLIHAITHIEFNAINLALDACYRFQNMPPEYYHNWLEVANDEVYHFSLLCGHLQEMGFKYGDFTAHNGLWDMAVRTEEDVLIRMALVPRVLEARGIDAMPELEKKLANVNNQGLNKTLSIIHHDEIKHVRYGDYWFKYECKSRNLNSEDVFLTLLDEYDAPKIRGAFNREGRKNAGFSDRELNHIAPQIKG